VLESPRFQEAKEFQTCLCSKGIPSPFCLHIKEHVGDEWEEPDYPEEEEEHLLLEWTPEKEESIPGPPKENMPLRRSTFTDPVILPQKLENPISPLPDLHTVIDIRNVQPFQNRFIHALNRLWEFLGYKLSK
jgi:hypothetical protein